MTYGIKFGKTGKHYKTFETKIMAQKTLKRVGGKVYKIKKRK